jgi:D-cysteine desulfhydrase
MTPDDVFPRDRNGPGLFDELPELRATVPWRPLAHVPTAVEPCDRIADSLGRGGVWMKRDDLISPLYGGNKVRRYEHVLADAEQKGARAIVTAGGLASTQVMATALFGRAIGIPVHAVLFDQPMTTFARTSMLTSATAGATLVYGGGYVSTAIKTYLAKRRLERSYLILPGAANPLANIGYVDAMLELSQQVARKEMPRPDLIVLPTGSSGTLAALALGAAYLGWDTQIVGVRITSYIACNRLTIGFLLRATESFLRERSATFRARKLRAPNFTLFHDAIGEGYGYPTPASVEGMREVERLTGQPGEVTYSGKALAALHVIANAKENRNKTILLWNTLSTPRPAIAEDAKDRLPASLARFFEEPVVA